MEANYPGMPISGMPSGMSAGMPAGMPAGNSDGSYPAAGQPGQPEGGMPGMNQGMPGMNPNMGNSGMPNSGMPMQPMPNGFGQPQPMTEDQYMDPAMMKMLQQQGALQQQNAHGKMPQRSQTSQQSAGKVPEWLRDPLIIAVLFFVLMQPAVRDFIEKYVTFLKSEQDGKMSMIAIAVYAVVLGGLYALIKKLMK